MWVSAVSSWEIALLVEANRLRLDRPVPVWTRDVLAQQRVKPVPLTARMAVAAVALGPRGFHRDPADRFLWATAELLGVPLVTKDGQIHEYGRGEDSGRLVW